MTANVQQHKASYSDWLQSKYGTIQELNLTCNTDFSSFEEFSNASLHSSQKEDRREWGGLSDDEVEHTEQEEKDPDNPLTNDNIRSPKLRNRSLSHETTSKSLYVLLRNDQIIGYSHDLVTARKRLSDIANIYSTEYYPSYNTSLSYIDADTIELTGYYCNFLISYPTPLDIFHVEHASKLR
jgi:hypothetical protein